MNRYVGYYIDGREMDPNDENRQLLFTAVTRVIAERGTMEDLKALVAYYQNEGEEIMNGRVNIAKVS